MTDSVVVALIALAGAIGSGAFALWQTRRTASVTERAARLAAESNDRIAAMDNLQRLCDQLQEQLATERTDRQAEAVRNRTEILELRSDMAMAMRGIRIRDDYIGVLRRYINDEGRPPPPDYPAALATLEIL